MYLHYFIKRIFYPKKFYFLEELCIHRG